MNHTVPNEVGVSFLFFLLFGSLILLWEKGCSPEPEGAPDPVNAEELVVVGTMDAPLRFSPFLTPSTSSL